MSFLSRRQAMVVPQNDENQLQYLAVSDHSLASKGVKWSDFPVDVMSLRTLKSTLAWNRPKGYFKRLTTFFQRLSILDLSVITLEHPLIIAYDSLAFQILGDRVSRSNDRIRQAINKPAPFWGISSRRFNVKANQKVTQDALPWTPTGCHQGDGHMLDPFLHGLMVGIGRAAAWPIRLPLMNLLSAMFFFGLYLTSTILYLGAFTAARILRNKMTHIVMVRPTPPMEVLGDASLLDLDLISPTIEASAQEMLAVTRRLAKTKGIVSESLQTQIGFIIVGSLVLSIVQSFFALIFLEIRKKKCLSALQAECSTQNDIWLDTMRKEGSSTFKQLHVIEAREKVPTAPAIQMSVRRYVPEKPKRFLASAASAIKALCASRMTYCVRYIECSRSYLEEFNQLHSPKSGPKGSKDEEEETDDFDEGSFVYAPVVVLPPIHSTGMAYALFSPQ